MRKLLIMSCILLIFTFGTSTITANEGTQIELVKVNTKVSNKDKSLTYQFTIKNVGKDKIRTIDYPGWKQSFGLHVNVRPKNELQKLMVMEKNTKYKKIELISGGGGVMDQLSPGETTTFIMNYKIKTDSDLNKVKEYARNGDLLILNGTELVGEIPLYK
jgi:hypothetical protein